MTAAATTGPAKGLVLIDTGDKSRCPRKEIPVQQNFFGLHRWPVGCVALQLVVQSGKFCFEDEVSGAQARASTNA
jgi:hypothetical protein